MSATDIIKLDDASRPVMMQALSLYINWISERKSGVTVGTEHCDELYKEYDKKQVVATKLYTSIKL